MPLIILATLFVVLFVLIVFALEESPFRDQKYLLGGTAALLCVLSMAAYAQPVFPIFTSIHVVLLPWAALGISMLFVVALMLFLKFRGWIGRRIGDNARYLLKPRFLIQGDGQKHQRHPRKPRNEKIRRSQEKHKRARHREATDSV